MPKKFLSMKNILSAGPRSWNVSKMVRVNQGSKFIPRVTNRLNLVKSLKKKQKHGRLIIAVKKRPTKGPLTALASLCAVYGPTLS